MLQWMKMDSNEFNGLEGLVSRTFSTYNGLHQERTYCTIFCEPRKRPKMVEYKDKFVVKEF
jgi:hypothetical protein